MQECSDTQYQKKYFHRQVQEKGAFLTEMEVQVMLLEQYREELEMTGNIGGG